jgi:hypothetical protein
MVLGRVVLEGSPGVIMEAVGIPGVSQSRPGSLLGSSWEQACDPKTFKIVDLELR